MRNASFDQKMPSLWHRAPDVLVAMIVREKKNRGKGRSMLAESATRLVHAACLLKVRYAAICRSMPPKAHRVLYPSGDVCQGASYMASIGVLVESASCAASILFRRFLQGKCTFRLDSMDAFRILGRSLRQQACDQGLHVSKKTRSTMCFGNPYYLVFSCVSRVKNLRDSMDERCSGVRCSESDKSESSRRRKGGGFHEGSCARGLEWRVGLARRGLRKGASGV